MRVYCEVCETTYDDLYRLTYCPHDTFQMATHVYRGGRFVGIATSIEKLNRMLAEPEPKP